MIVVPAIHVDLSTSKEMDEVLKNITTRGRLNNHKRGLYLPANRHAAVSIDGTTETAFSINETDSPSAVKGSFLLIVRTSHIVTAVHYQTIQIGCNTDFGQRVVEDTTDFPAYSRLLTATSPLRGAAPLCLQRGIPTLGPL